MLAKLSKVDILLAIMVTVAANAANGRLHQGNERPTHCHRRSNLFLPQVPYELVRVDGLGGMAQAPVLPYVASHPTQPQRPVLPLRISSHVRNVPFSGYVQPSHEDNEGILRQLLLGHSE